MKTDTRFSDATGREWTISINAPTVKRLREKMGVDLLDTTGKIYQDLIKDVIKLVDVLYVVCEPQAQQQSITDQEFGQAMAGDAIDQATSALVKGVANFLGTSRGAPLQAAAGKTAQMFDIGFKQTAEDIESIDVKKILDDARDKLKKSEPQEIA